MTTDCAFGVSVFCGAEDTAFGGCWIACRVSRPGFVVRDASLCMLVFTPGVRSGAGLPAMVSVPVTILGEATGSGLPIAGLDSAPDGIGLVRGLSGEASGLIILLLAC